MVRQRQGGLEQGQPRVLTGREVQQAPHHLYKHTTARWSALNPCYAAEAMYRECARSPLRSHPVHELLRTKVAASNHTGSNM